MIQTMARQMTPVVRAVSWRGRSGRLYALTPRRLEDFSLAGDELYLVALGNVVLWIGSAAELIEDAHSRARFRLALDCADRVFRVEQGGDALERMTVIWDLEAAEPVSGLSAA